MELDDGIGPYVQAIDSIKEIELKTEQSRFLFTNIANLFVQVFEVFFRQRPQATSPILFCVEKVK